MMGLVAGLGGTAAAQSDEWQKQERERVDAERWKSGREQLDGALKHPAARPGLETAPVRAPTWCASVKDPPRHNPSSIRMHLEGVSRNGTNELLLAAAALCDEPNEPVYQRTAAEIEQLWINNTGLSDKQAVESITARIDSRTFEAAKKQLCDALTVSDEVAGELRVHMSARRDLFDCGSGVLQHHMAVPPMGTLVPYLDASATEPDELVRLDLVDAETNYTNGDASADYRDKHLAAYAVDQYDYKALAPDKLEKLLDAEPYRGNLYARTVVHETLAHARMELAAIESAVAKHASDDDWKELLVTAPRRGFAAWAKGAAPWKEALARSNEFEMKAFGPSRKALAGCLPPLRKDAVAVLKTLKHGSPEELQQQMSDHPVAGLLMKRLVLCMAADGDATLASSMRAALERVRVTRGPRSMGYFSALDALSKIHSATWTSTATPRAWSSRCRRAPRASRWVDTNHILQFRADGSPLYQQRCKDTGLFTVNDTPAPIEVASELADGIAPGRLVVFLLLRGPARTAPADGGLRRQEQEEARGLLRLRPVTAARRPHQPRGRRQRSGAAPER